MKSKLSENRIKIQQLVVFSTISAIIIILSLIPQLGYIRLGPASITIVHIPALVGVLVLPFAYSYYVGFVFGLFSMVAAYIYGATPIDLAFQNPIISILPRVIFCVIVSYIYHKAKKIDFFTQNRFLIVYGFTIAIITGLFLLLPNILQTVSDNTIKASLTRPIFIMLLVLFIVFITNYVKKILESKKTLIIPIILLLGTIIHTVVVIGILLLIKPNILGVSFIKILSIIIATNGFVEAFLAVAIGTPIVYALKANFAFLNDNFYFVKGSNNEVII